MRTQFIRILLALLVIVLAGCSTSNEIKRKSERNFSSVSEFSDIKRNKDDNSKKIIKTENIKSSTKQEIVNKSVKIEHSDIKKLTTSSKNISTEKTQMSTENNNKALSKTKSTHQKKPAETNSDPKSKHESIIQIADCSDVEAKVAAYINQYRSSRATVLNGLTKVARHRSQQLVTNFSHSDGIDVCNALQYGEFVDMTLYGMPESDSYYQGYNREAIAKGNWTGTADEIAQSIANGFKNSSSHWSYLGSSEYSYIAVGCTYDESNSMWYCCICISSKNYGG